MRWLHLSKSKTDTTGLWLAETHDLLRVVDDQIDSPTFTSDLAPLLCGMLENE